MTTSIRSYNAQGEGIRSEVPLIPLQCHGFQAELQHVAKQKTSHTGK
jgi:hypothetical protein